MEHELLTGVDPSSKSQLNVLAPGNGGPTVQVTTLDAFCNRERIASIDILKTDTEGYDARVLSGARRMLSEKRIHCVVSEVGFIGDRYHTPLCHSPYQRLPARWLVRGQLLPKW
jgi:hypothetical protein